MLYYKAKKDAYDFFSKHSIVKDELLTVRERNRLVPFLSDSVFDAIVIPKTRTFTMFGVRKEIPCEKIDFKS